MPQYTITKLKQYGGTNVYETTSSSRSGALLCHSQCRDSFSNNLHPYTHDGGSFCHTFTHISGILAHDPFAFGCKTISYRSFILGYKQVQLVDMAQVYVIFCFITLTQVTVGHDFLSRLGSCSL